MGWFARNPRDLPWRRTLDPYAIWVSEIMLQQTQVKTVIPYWERWMQELPDVSALATAKPERVLKLWEGLGYYTRARNLQLAATQIVAGHGGQFPKTFDEVLNLPGVGRYTAGAICSIAYNHPAPIVDGNVIRVLTRLFGIRENPRDKAVNDRVWQLAQGLVVTARGLPLPRFPRPTKLTGACSALNQSVMEFGALICTPRQPRCAECPLASSCVARRQGIAEELPNLGGRIRVTARHLAAFVTERRGRFLVRRRPAGVINAHLWEFPTVELASADDGVAVAAANLGLRLTSAEPLCVVNHSITRYRISMRAFEAGVSRVDHRRQKLERWLPLTGLDALAFTSAHRRILRAVMARVDAARPEIRIR
jgi:A/G-specific adenine glycosylase